MKKEEAIRRIKEFGLYHAIGDLPNSAKTVEAFNMAIEALSERTGEWIFNPKDAIELMFTKPKCSKCGFESADGGNFCPNCGKPMLKKDGETE